MSRFTQVLNSHVFENDTPPLNKPQPLDSTALELMLDDTLDILEAGQGRITLEADYFMEQHSPVTDIPGVMPLRICMDMAKRKFQCSALRLTVGVHGKTCCPCSKLISSYDEETERGRGAHSQRGYLEMVVQLHPGQFLWIEQLASIGIASFSSPVYPILKRPDEKHVTERAYGNPKFVEDVSRDAALQLTTLVENGEIENFKVKVTNSESIHHHDAFAVIRG